MYLPSTRSRTRSWPVRAIALLLLVLQGAQVVLPSLEAREASGPPAVHVEEKDARHVDLHNDATCILCAARGALAALPPSAPSPAVLRHVEAVAASQARVATPADRSVGNLSRAPPRTV